jgi:hypothetical protein
MTGDKRGTESKISRKRDNLDVAAALTFLGGCVVIVLGLAYVDLLFDRSRTPAFTLCLLWGGFCFVVRAFFKP